MFNRSSGYKTTVYPRWRGEHCIAFLVSKYLVGLSPLARGTLGDCSSTQMNTRFIPAGAGNTSASNLQQQTLPVYPRWRGEHRLHNIRRLSASGLSPLARGTRGTRYTEIIRSRFIPAGAGNTHLQRWAVSAISVYPRWRGEHSRTGLNRYATRGLSPLARGTPEHFDSSEFACRFIPAGAGNT